MAGYEIPDVIQKYLDSIYGFDPTQYGGVGMGKIGRDARKDLSYLRSGGDISGLAGFAGTLGAIKSGFGAQNRSALRNISMDPTIALQHPELVAAKQAEYQRGANQDQANTIAGAASDFSNRQQDVFQRAYSDAQGRRQNAAQMRLQALLGAGNLAGSTMQQKGPGILGKIIGGGLGAVKGFLAGGPAGAVVGGVGGALGSGGGGGLFRTLGSASGKFGNEAAGVGGLSTGIKGGSLSSFFNKTAGPDTTDGAPDLPGMPGGMGGFSYLDNQKKKGGLGQYMRPQPYQA